MSKHECSQDELLKEIRKKLEDLVVFKYVLLTYLVIKFPEVIGNVISVAKAVWP